MEKAAARFNAVKNWFQTESKFGTETPQPNF
jgi:hypothetical protein